MRSDLRVPGAPVHSFHDVFARLVEERATQQQSFDARASCAPGAASLHYRATQLVPAHMSVIGAEDDADASTPCSSPAENSVPSVDRDTAAA